ncbi:MAG: PD-(D/E)XK nuclease family protein [Bacilli bacterium]|nr:PD-(D/E)XK nuclease family protein [Bacilli bacterium]
MIKIIKTNFQYQIIDYLKKEIKKNIYFITSETNITHYKKQIIKVHLSGDIKVISLKTLFKDIIKNNNILNRDKQKLYFLLAIEKVNNDLVYLKDYHASIVDSIIDIYNKESDYNLQKINLSQAMNDINLIIKQYLSLLPNDVLDKQMLYNKVSKYLDNKQFIDSDIIIDYLPFINYQERELLRKIGLNNNLTIFTYQNIILRQNDYLLDHYNYFKTLAKEECVIDNDLGLEKTSYLENKVSSEVPSYLEICENRDLHEEVITAAGQILKLISEKSATLNDFTIVSNNIDDYVIYLNAIFKPLNLNYQNSCINDYKFFEFINDLILLPNNLFNKQIINILGYHYIKIDPSTSEKYIDNIYQNHLENELYNDDIKEINVLLEELKNCLVKTDISLIKDLYLLIDNVIYKNIIDIDIYNKWIEFVDNYTDVYSKEVNIDSFLDTFSYWYRSIMLDNDYTNEIKVSSLKQASYIKTKYVFIIGLNETIIPKKISNNLLGNSSLYKNYPIFLPIYQEEYNFTHVLLSHQKVYLSYTLTSNNNKKLKRSSYLKKVLTIYPNLPILKQDIKTISYANKAFYSWYHMYYDQEVVNKLNDVFLNSNLKEEWSSFLKPLPLEKYYHNHHTLYLSPSKIDTYVKCPFKYYIQNIIKIKENKNFIFDNALVGTYVHFLLEKLINNIKLDENEMTINCKNDFVDMYLFLKKPLYLYLLEKLRIMTLYIYQNIKKELKQSNYKTAFTELNLRDDSSLKLTYNINNVTVNMTGIIDRIDESDNYLRIIDYKTGNKKIDYNNFLNGLDMQLFIYMNVLAHNNDKKVAGIFYMPVFISFAEEQTSYKLKGLFLNSEDNIKDLGDLQIDNYIEAYSRDKLNHCVLYDEIQYQNMLEITNQKINEIAGDIISGKIDIAPLQESKVCDYCSYKAICGIEISNEKRYLTKYSKDDIKKRLGGDITDELD